MTPIHCPRSWKAARPVRGGGLLRGVIAAAALIVVVAAPAAAQTPRGPTPEERAWLGARLSALASESETRREAERRFVELSRSISSRHAGEPMVELSLRAELVGAAVSGGLLGRAAVEVSELDELARRVGGERAMGLLRSATVATAEALIASGNAGAARGLFRREVYREGVSERDADRVRLVWAMAEVQSGAPAGDRIALKLVDQVRAHAGDAGGSRLGTVAAWIGVIASGSGSDGRYRETLDATANGPGTREGAIFPLVAGVLIDADAALVESAAGRLLAFAETSESIGAMDLLAAAALLAQRDALLETADRVARRAAEAAGGDELSELAEITRAKIAARLGDAEAPEASADTDLSLEFGWSYAGPADAGEAPRLLFRVVRDGP